MNFVSRVLKKMNRKTFIKSAILTVLAPTFLAKLNSPIKFGLYNVYKPPYPNMRCGDWIIVSEDGRDIMQNKIIFEANDIDGWIRYLPTLNNKCIDRHHSIFENNLKFRLVYRGKDKEFLKYS